MPDHKKSPGSGRMIVGLILIILGLGFLFERLGLFGFYDFNWLASVFWPLIFIILGIVMLAKRHIFSGLILLVLGLAWQLAELFNLSAWSIIWPSVIVVIGICFFLPKKRGYRFGGSISGTETTDELDESVTFWGNEKQINSDNFKGGKIDCSFGGVKLDLRDVTLVKGGAEINIKCSFGGVEIRLPRHCRVESKGTSFLGSWENRFEEPRDSSWPLLKISGSVSFGGVEIKD